MSAVFMAVVAGFAVLANGGYEWAIMLPKEQAAAHRLFRLSSLFAVLTSGIALCLALMLGPFLIDRLRQPDLESWYLWIPVSIGIEGLCQALRVALNRNEQYKALSAARIANHGPRCSVAWHLP